MVDLENAHVALEDDKGEFFLHLECFVNGDWLASRGRDFKYRSLEWEDGKALDTILGSEKSRVVCRATHSGTGYGLTAKSRNTGSFSRVMRERGFTHSKRRSFPKASVIGSIFRIVGCAFSCCRSAKLST